MQEQTNPQPSVALDLWRYLAILKRWLWLLVLAVVLGAGIAFIISITQVPVYQSSATILINAAPSTASGADYSSVLASKQIASTYVMLFTERIVLEKVAASLPTTTTVKALREMTQVSLVRDTQLVDIKVENTSPQMAAVIANTMVSVFSEVIQDMQSQRYQDSKANIQAQMKSLELLMQTAREELSALGNVKDDPRVDRLQATLSQYQQSYTNLLQTYEQIRLTESQTSSSVTQVETAIAPDTPIRPRTATNTLLGGVVGLLLAFGLIFLLESLDDTLRNVSDIPAQWGLPLLSFIPYFDLDEKGAGPITNSQPRSPIAERFRSLRTSIQYASVDKPLRTIMVTSPMPSDGKTTVATNLAVILAQSGRRVVLVDADMRRPTVHRHFSMPNIAGLSTLFVADPLVLDGALQSTDINNLSLLTAGSLPPNPAELLSSERMVEIQRLLGDVSDMIILDTPPATAVTDAVALAPRVDGVLIVVQPGSTHVGAFRQTVEEMRRAGANLLGVVVNGVKASDGRYYYGGYYHYRSDDRYNEPLQRNRSRNPLTRLWRRVRRKQTQQDTKPKAIQTAQ